MTNANSLKFPLSRFLFRYWASRLAFAGYFGAAAETKNCDRVLFDMF